MTSVYCYKTKRRNKTLTVQQLFHASDRSVQYLFSSKDIPDAKTISLSLSHHTSDSFDKSAWREAIAPCRRQCCIEHSSNNSDNSADRRLIDAWLAVKALFAVDAGDARRTTAARQATSIVAAPIARHARATAAAARQCGVVAVDRRCERCARQRRRSAKNRRIARRSCRRRLYDDNDCIIYDNDDDDDGYTAERHSWRRR